MEWEFNTYLITFEDKSLIHRAVRVKMDDEQIWLCIFCSSRTQNAVHYTLDLRKILGVEKKFLKSRSFLYLTQEIP